MEVSEGKCFRDCEGFSILFGSVFSHGTMAHNEVKEMECPSSGEFFRFRAMPCWPRLCADWLNSAPSTMGCL